MPTGVGHDYCTGVSSIAEPDGVRADPERILQVRLLQPAGCGVVWLERFFTGLYDFEEFLAVFADQGGIERVQYAGFLHHLA